MAKSSGLILIVLMVFAPISVVTAKVVYVDVNSPNDPGTGTASDPFRRIQDAISDASTGSGDEIEIRPGVYTGPGNYNIDPNGFSITIRSIDPNDPEIVSSTIIDPNRAGRGFDLHRGESRNCVIAGLTIRNGYTASGTDGGAIRCSNGSGPTIRNCVIRECEATIAGGGIFCTRGSPYIVGCLIIDNSASWYGGGVSFVNCNNVDIPDIPIIIGCKITGNKAGWESGAIDLGRSNLILTNCVIADNEAVSKGGGINCFDSSNLNMINCTAADNIASDSGGGLYCSYNSSAQIRNSIFWANESNQGSQVSLPFLYGFDSSASVYYSDVQDGPSGVFVDPCSTLNWEEGNISIDPNFAIFGPGVEAELWDFHLSSKAGRWDASISDWVQDEFTSSCVDAGDPNSDYAREPWPHGGRVNMGAYGGTDQASMNGNRADFNIDETVNLIDFAEFALRWLNNEACIEDMSGDGKVDSTDLSILAYNWLWQSR
jgi:hypothetical protein